MQPIEFSRKIFLLIALAYVAMLSYSFISSSNRYLTSGITLKATIITPAKGHYKSEYIQGRGQFISGMEGDLLWMPKNLTESMILTCIADKSTDLFDIAGVIITATLIYFMFMDSKEGSIFTKKMYYGFIIVIFFVLTIDTSSDLLRSRLTDYYMPYIANGQFKIYNIHKLPMSHVVFGLMIFLLRIPKSGLDLQKEQDLTI